MAENRFLFLQSNFFIRSKTVLEDDKQVFKKESAVYGNGYESGPEWSVFVYRNILRYKKILPFGFFKQKDIYDVTDIIEKNEWCEDSFDRDFFLTGYALLTYTQADYSKFILKWCDRDMSKYLKDVKDIGPEDISLEACEKVWGRDVLDKLEKRYPSIAEELSK